MLCGCCSDAWPARASVLAADGPHASTSTTRSTALSAVIGSRQECVEHAWTWQRSELDYAEVGTLATRADDVRRVESAPPRACPIVRCRDVHLRLRERCCRRVGMRMHYSSCSETLMRMRARRSKPLTQVLSARARGRAYVTRNARPPRRARTRSRAGARCSCTSSPITSSILLASRQAAKGRNLPAQSRDQSFGPRPRRAPHTERMRMRSGSSRRKYT
jgi:hypothetical protein